MRFKQARLLAVFTILASSAVRSQDAGLLTIDRVFASSEFRQEYQTPIQWIENGEAYLMVVYTDKGNAEIKRYQTATQTSTAYLSTDQLTPEGSNTPIFIEDFSLSDDESKVLIFTNSKRVWRSNTKGDYWVYDFSKKKLSQLGKDFPASSLMFAKFSADNDFVAYVMGFNIYKEDFSSGVTTQLTSDGNREIINGTFDWVYEEEFGCRDGFRWSPDGSLIAFWQLDASTIGSYNMINFTDSVYSQVIPVQYPKVGQDPSSAQIGIINTFTGDRHWVELEGSIVQNYIPGIQWINKDLLLIQQMNRKQNHLKFWGYRPSSKETKLIYEEQSESWVDLQYPDITANNWGDNKLEILSNGKSALRLIENEWRKAIKIDLNSGSTTLISTGTYDVASIAGTTPKELYYMASPNDVSQRYLYSVDLKGRKQDRRITPAQFSGTNTYNISPNGKYAFHSFRSALSPIVVDLISLPDHKVISSIVDNKVFKNKLYSLKMPTVKFQSFTTTEGIEVNARFLLPHDFDASKLYPVIFHVYGEPWGQVAQDSWVGLWTIYLTQLGYIVVDVDPRGAPVLNGSEWRKSIYQQIGRINILDLGQATQEITKLPYVDDTRVGVWGWSGGGSSTLNLMFQFPETFHTGVAVASVANQLTYDNIYQERYMGLPQENIENFMAGSPITHAKNLEGNLLMIHGTGDDNVHYQNMEMLVDELIAQNKQFDMMSYPNRSHGIYEGRNTRRHLYTLITNYFLEKLPVK